MCVVFGCGREFQGWFKSFTRLESWLSALVALILVVLLGCITFLILHLLACANLTNDSNIEPIKPHTSTPSSKTPSVPPLPDIPSVSPRPDIPNNSSLVTETTAVEVSLFDDNTSLSTDIECTWNPSHKTVATIRYYYWRTKPSVHSNLIYNQSLFFTKSVNNSLDDEDIINVTAEEPNTSTDESDASRDHKHYVAALVKLKPPEKMTFGCILTKVTQVWTLTAASCIEVVEEVDSLDSFFIVDSYGEAVQWQWQGHAVVDVQIHPMYEGSNRAYDIAALRSEDDLVPSTRLLLRLPTMLDYFLVAPGERFTILGYGEYRTIATGPEARRRRLRQVRAYTLSLRQCAGACSAEAGAWSLRHLSRGAAVGAGACSGGAALCAGLLPSRPAPLSTSPAPTCNYCAGTPLLRERTLYAIMGQNRQCGVSCEPALYVSVAVVRDWLDSFVFI